MVAKRIRQLQSIANPAEQDKIQRIMAFDSLAKIKRRIHKEGKASDDSKIGSYSKEYLTVRTGNFKNNKATKGKNKGNARIGRAGTFIKGANKGNLRPRYNRDDDSRVVISLTRKLENSYAILPTGKGYGVGFIDQSVSVPNEPESQKNVASIDKANWVEQTYGKRIFALTNQEKNEAFIIAEKEVNRRLNV